MNSTHSIVGYYLDSNIVYHGFIRSPSGEIKTLTAPGAGGGVDQGTFPMSINDKGEIAGYYFSSNSVFVAFHYSAGKFTEFEAPGVGNESGQGTAVAYFDGLTEKGVIAGYATDSNYVSHGYLRTPEGKFTEFDPMGSDDTYVTGINAHGTVAGFYTDSSGARHGFVREANGVITDVNVPNAVKTLINGINASGASAGQYYDGSWHGFVRSAPGDISTFDPPGAILTEAISINAAGSIIGYWEDSSGVGHGFIRK
jgi:hypothetical protein